METNRTKTRLLTVAVAALMALTVVPVLAASASAAATPAATSAGTSSQWAYGGQGSDSGRLTLGAYNLSWNGSATVDVVYNATNVSANITELTATRTVVVSVTASYSGPNASWTYDFRAAEQDHAAAYVTNAANVSLVPGGTVVPALGLINASLAANASVAASVAGTLDGKSASAYLNASGWAKAQVALSPALGLIPLNLTGVSGWTSSSNASGSAAWNLSWSYVDHAFNGTGGSRTGDVNGTWSTATEVTLNGRVAPSSYVWNDHRARTAIGLALNGPFDLHDGFVLVPHGFDLFGGADARGLGGYGLGSADIASEYVFVNTGRISARSVTAANLTASAATPDALVGDSVAASPAVALPQASSATPTVWAQPMSPAAAEQQATCAYSGCGGGSNLLGGLVVPLAIGAVVAVAAIALIASRRPRKGTAADVPLGAAPAGVVPPTGTGSAPYGGPLPPH